MTTHPSAHPIDSLIQPTPKGARLDLPIYAYRDGHGNLCIGDENWPVANQIQMMEHLLYALIHLYKGRRPLTAKAEPAAADLVPLAPFTPCRAVVHAPMAVSNLHLDLPVRLGERRDLQQGVRGVGLAEELAAKLGSHVVEVGGHVGDENSHLDYLPERCSGLREDALDVPEGLPALRQEVAGDRAAFFVNPKAILGILWSQSNVLLRAGRGSGVRVR